MLEPMPTVPEQPPACCIVGGGPAGMVLALLLARRGVPVTLLEAHRDFDRDFRGDTIHPSTLEALDQIGLAEPLLRLPHGRLEAMRIHSAGRVITVAEFHRLRTKFPFIMILPQARFLDFLAHEARQYPSFRLLMSATVRGLIEENGVVHGVRYRAADDLEFELRAPVTIGADGRFSKIRHLCGAVPIRASPPMDVLWFRIPRESGDARDQLAFFADAGQFAFFLDRGREWQVGYAIVKGTFAELKSAGLAVLRDNLSRLAPWAADRAATLRDWSQVQVLNVESSRVPTWHRPGLLLIGDAAHVMSPVGGVGINVAIQDAIEAANVLAGPLLDGSVTEDRLAEVQRRREQAVRAIQRFQAFIQDRVVRSALDSSRPFRLPWIVRLLLHVPWVRDWPARLIAFGPRRVRIET
jgi:2-polyprenyl-6-methoxyphenol hydroxylase-like FAD-dependent oxidoreductase